MNATAAKTTETRKRQFAYYNDSELCRAANAPKLSLKTRLAMLEEIRSREDEAEAVTSPAS